MSSFKSLRGAFIRRCRSVVLGMSIRVKLLGLILTLVLALGHAITFQARHAVEKTLRSHLAVEGSSIAQNVAARATDLILVNDLFTLKELLKDIRGGCENIRYIFILDPYGYILAHTFGEGFPVPLINANEPTAAGFDRTVKLKTTEGLIWDTAVPISNGRVGVARVGISDADHRRDITHLTLRLITTTSVVAFIAILSSSFLVWFITRPIRSLAAAAEAVGRGDFSHRTGIRTRDELGALSKTFDQMTAELAKVRAERLAWERLHKQLLERVYC
ncbi:MAG: HAMP domain-containing protein [Candidatus Eisenbacteria bacterium]|nr:HAMP domain-containing protein [Candidatus Eisenbacteria bacterium]